MSIIEEWYQIINFSIYTYNSQQIKRGHVVRVRPNTQLKILI